MWQNQYLCFGKTFFIYFSEMLKVNHAFQIQGDVINECREDGKASFNIGKKNACGETSPYIAGKGQNYTQTSVQTNLFLIV